MSEVQPKPELAETLTGTARPREPLPSTPATDRYALRDEIGRGGMGVVQLWTDPHVGRDVAAKVLLHDAEEQRVRFLREARTQGRLEHPAIVPVYDLASLPDGRPFFTMKRIQGVTLASILTVRAGRTDEGGTRFTQRKLLGAMAQLALAMDFVHQRGFLHRDLKPANIMLGDFGEVYVLDWGIARRIDEVELASRASLADLPSGLTADGSLLGTPGYMAPEQVRTESTLDARTDVYALGCVLFEILAGEPLHRGQIAAALVASTLGSPERSPRDRAPSRDVPPELDALVLAATEPTPADRLGSMRELAERLERYLEGDRDMALRASAAESHAEEASRRVKVALDEATSPAEAEEARRTALREVGRALALRPDHPPALATLSALLTTPPRVLPPEVAGELAAIESAHVRVGGRTGAAVYGGASLVLAGFLAAGALAIGPASLLSLALFSVAAATSFALSRLAQPRVVHSMTMLVLSTAALVSLSGLFGSLLVVPVAIAVNTMIFVVSNGRAVRAGVIAVGGLAAAAPLALEALGVLSPSFRLEDGALVLLPRALPFEPLSLGVLGVTFVATVALGALALTPFKDDLDRAQREGRVLGWQLRQFVPVPRTTSRPPPRA